MRGKVSKITHKKRRRKTNIQITHLFMPDPRDTILYICKLLQKLGFEERIHGSHHVFTKEGIEEIINLQPKGAKAKSYQVKQVRNLILKYKLGG